MSCKHEQTKHHKPSTVAGRYTNREDQGPRRRRGRLQEAIGSRTHVEAHSIGFRGDIFAESPIVTLVVVVLFVVWFWSRYHRHTPPSGGRDDEDGRYVDYDFREYDYVDEDA